MGIDIIIKNPGFYSNLSCISRWPWRRGHHFPDIERNCGLPMQHNMICLRPSLTLFHVIALRSLGGVPESSGEPLVASASYGIPILMLAVISARVSAAKSQSLAHQSLPLINTHGGAPCFQNSIHFLIESRHLLWKSIEWRRAQRAAAVGVEWTLCSCCSAWRG